MKYGPELLDEIEKLEAATNMVVTGFEWSPDKGKVWTLSEKGPELLDFVSSEFIDLFNDQVICVTADADVMVIEYHTDKVPSDLEVENINQELRDRQDNLEVIKSSKTIIIHPIKPI